MLFFYLLTPSSKEKSLISGLKWEGALRMAELKMGSGRLRTIEWTGCRSE
jgi:hypothetical protein